MQQRLQLGAVAIDSGVEGVLSAHGLVTCFVASFILLLCCVV